MKNYNYYKFIILFMISFLIINQGESQVLISSSNDVPHSSAMLEVRSTTQGLLIPRMTSADRATLSLTAAEGLLVYDTDKEAFFLRGNGEWIDLSSSSEIWTQKDNDVYLTNTLNNIGVGTSAPGGKFVIKADGSKLPDDALFEIQDASGEPIFVVTSEGARMYVKDYTLTKGVSGGFAVGRYGAAKGLPTEPYFVVTPDSTRVYTASKSKAVSGGFAVGRYGAAKAGDTLFFYTNPDSTRIYTKTTAKGVAGGFAVGRYGAAKAGTDNYMFMVPDNYFIGHQAGDSLQTGRYTGIYNTFFGYQSGLKDTVGSNNVFIGHTTGYNNTDGKYNVFLGNQSGYNNTGSGGGISGSQNVFLGFQAGYKNTTGADNVMIGWNAGHENTTAGSNIAIGSKAGYSNTESIHNVFIGEFAGLYHKTGANNIYMGFNSGRGPDTIAVPLGGRGVDNIFIGTETGITNTTGVSNVFIGESSGRTNTTGSNNVAVGTLAGWQTTEGLNNVFLGNNSGYTNASGNTNVFIGNGAGNKIADHNDNIFIGGFAGYDAVSGDNNIFMGVSAGANHQDGNDNIFMGNNAAVGITGTGNASVRNVILGTNAGTFIDDALDNVIIGHKAGEGIEGTPMTGDFNVIIGERAGNLLGMGQQNVFLGNLAGFNTTTGDGNIFLGFSCGYSNTTGSYNTFLGYEAGRDNSTGSGNLFIGNMAGYLNTGGSHNTILGYWAGLNVVGNQNTIVGYYAGKDNIASGNVFLGAQAGLLNEDGSSNVVIGNEAGTYNNGSSNVLLGRDAGRGNGVATTFNYSIAIGNEAGFLMEGNNNVFLGHQSGSSNTGADNVYLGFHAGRSSGAGSRNVFIGYQAGWGETNSDRLYIENTAGDLTEALIYGEFDNGLVRINSNLNINGAYTFPNVDGAADEVLITDGGGNLSWADVNSVVTGDNLGNHTATTNLNVNSNAVTNVSSLTLTSDYIYEKLRLINVDGYSIGMRGGNTLGYLNGYATTFTMRNSPGYGWVWRAFGDALSAGAMSLTYDGQLYVHNTSHFNGNVGIGTGNPATNTTLHVLESGTVLGSQISGTVACFQQNSGTGNWSRISIIGGNAGSSVLDLGDAQNQEIGRVLYNHSGNYMSFNTNNSEKMRIESDGDVGIGVTPSFKLHVVDDYIAIYGSSVNDLAATYGIYGVASGNTGVDPHTKVGVYGGASGTGSGLRAGILGTASGGSSTWAGYFSGNVRVTGTFDNSKSAMLIDHPTDPENKVLYHSSVESPDMMNIYNGNVILNGSGEAIVKLPDYFEALNMEFRYQLTAIGAPGPNLYIAEEISGNSFKIAGGTSGMKVSWQVTGIRQDPYANQNRIEVEVDKKADERGKYLHPEVYDQPKEKGIDYEMIKGK